MIAVNWFPINAVDFLILAEVILEIACILGDGGIPSANRAWGMETVRVGTYVVLGEPGHVVVAVLHMHVNRGCGRQRRVTTIPRSND